MSVKPSTTRRVTVTDHQSPTASKAPAQIGNAPSQQKDYHPLPPARFDAQDTTLAGINKKFLDMYEAMRVRTDAMAKNPMTAPAFERRVAFQNNTANAAQVTVTFSHSLGRAPTNGVTCYHSEGAPYQGYSVSNPNGEDPATHQTIVATVPANTTAYHSFFLHAL